MNAAAPHYQTDFPSAEFSLRRQRILEVIGRSAVAVLQGAPTTGAFDVFRQTNDFYYLCGIETPHACLLLDGRSQKTIAYLPQRDARHERSEGPQLNSDDPETVQRLTGVDDVRPLPALAADVKGAAFIHTPFAPGEGKQACRDTLHHQAVQRSADPWDGLAPAEQRFRERLAQVAPAAEFRDLSPTLDEMRTVKSERELNLMRRAGRLCAAAVTAAIKATRPGVWEYQLAGLADFLYTTNRAQGAGYRAIVAAGRNIWNAHYWRNNCQLQDRELVLMDYAPDVGYYTSDIGRIWPVSGRYLPEQRELYGLIVEYHKALLRRLRPGATAAQVMRETADEMRPVVEKTRWSRPSFGKAARALLEFNGHCSHGVGMAVHDVGNYQTLPLRPGVVFALDPQLWSPEDELYIRVEDTVAITDNGVEVLTAGAPLELDEVERLVGSSDAIPLPILSPEAA